MSDKISVEDFRLVALQKQMLMDNSDILFIMRDQNTMINEFCDTILPQFVDTTTNMIDKNRALELLSTFANGKEVRKAYDYYKMLKFDEKAMKEIIEILQKPVPELYMIGQVAIQIMFGMFDAYVRKWWNEQRYSKIYKSDSFQKWLRKIKEYPEIDSATAMFKYHNYALVQRKVTDILNTKIKI